MPFSEKLSQIRRLKKLTQLEVAQQAGVGIAQVRRYEKGSSSPTLEAIKKLSLTLGVSADELIFESNEQIAAGKILDKDLLEQFEIISHMTPHDLDAIKTVLDGMIVKSRLEGIMSTRDKSWERDVRSVVSEFRASAEDRSEEEIESLIDEAVDAVRAEKISGGEQNIGT